MSALATNDHLPLQLLQDQAFDNPNVQPFDVSRHNHQIPIIGMKRTKPTSEWQMRHGVWIEMRLCEA